MKDYLKKSAMEAGLILSDDMIDKFQIYFDFLIETNKLLNLTAITEMHDVVLKHFVDSMSVIKFFDLSDKKIIDVGTGAGFPGIPLAIINPNAEFVLMDSLKKRLNFIDQAAELCEISNITTVHGRAEDLGQNSHYREQFDFCVSRAVASLPVLLELCTPFVKVGGHFISYKSEMLNDELKLSEHALSELHCKLESENMYTIPNTDYCRIFATFTKNSKLAKKYPRQAGKPKKNPL